MNKWLEQHVMDAQRGNVPLLALLAEGTNSLFPRADDSPNPGVPAPFLVNKFGGRAGSIVRVTGWQTFVYDDPERRYWRINEIVRVLQAQFDNLELPPTEHGYPQWQRCRAETESGQVDDGGWGKNLIIVRFSVWAI